MDRQVFDFFLSSEEMQELKLGMSRQDGWIVEFDDVQCVEVT